MTATTLPKISLGHLPTPVHRLERLSEQLGGPELWIKRDDLTGLAMGGNKVRKLEYLLAQAQAEGADTVITAGAVQSNHCRQTAGAAARLGMRCVLVLGADDPGTRAGNLLLDELFGAEIIWIGDTDRSERLRAEADRARADGRRPYLIPVGGSNPLGAASYAYAMHELLAQEVKPDRIVVASSSGGTQAGLLAGAQLFGYSGRVTGIHIGKSGKSEKEELLDLAHKAAELLGEQIELSEDQLDLRTQYSEPGYAVLTDLERDAILRFARAEGVLLDPVYTGRAAGGMLDLIERGEIGSDERVLFWHTGGTPALFAYGEQLISHPW